MLKLLSPLPQLWRVNHLKVKFSFTHVIKSLFQGPMSPLGQQIRGTGRKMYSAYNLIRKTVNTASISKGRINLPSTPLYRFRLLKTCDSRFWKRGTLSHDSNPKPSQNLQTEKNHTQNLNSLWNNEKRLLYSKKSVTQAFGFYTVQIQYLQAMDDIVRALSLILQLPQFLGSVFGMAHVDGASIQGWFFVFRCCIANSVQIF